MVIYTNNNNNNNNNQRKPPKQHETQNIENQIITEPRNRSILTQEFRTNIKLILKKHHDLTEDNIIITKESRLRKNQV